MKKRIAFLILSISVNAWSQEAAVDIKLRPAGSFKGKSSEVKGFATQKGDEVEAKDINVVLKNITTGIKLRDEHTRKYLEVEKFPDATLVSAKGKGGKGEGIIRIRGIEKPIAGTYKVEGGKLMAEFPIKLSEFNISGIKYMGIGVDDNAKINVTVPVQAAATTAAVAPAAAATKAPAGKAPVAPAPKKK